MLRPTMRRSLKRQRKEAEVEKAVRALENKVEQMFLTRTEANAKTRLVESSVVAYLSVFLNSLQKELARSAIKGKVSLHTINTVIESITTPQNPHPCSKN